MVYCAYSIEAMKKMKWIIYIKMDLCVYVG